MRIPFARSNLGIRHRPLTVVFFSIFTSSGNEKFIKKNNHITYALFFSIHFVIIIKSTSTTIRTTITVMLLFSPAERAKRSSRVRARPSCVACLSTWPSTSSSRSTCSSSSSPMRMLSSRWRPMLAPSWSSWASCSAMTRL